MTTKITLCAEAKLYQRRSKEGRRCLEIKPVAGRGAKSIALGAGMEILRRERIEAREGLM
jgi:hypothetical protein